MGVKVVTLGRLPLACWDRQAMRETALAARAIIVTRTFRHGLDINDQPFKPYSTRPMTVTTKPLSSTAKRMKPRGGLPAFGRGHPRKLLGAGGKKPKGAKWTITGRHYPGGYAQYKRESRKGVNDVDVNLTLSGELQRSIKIKDVEQDRATVGLEGNAIVYGMGVQQRGRVFMGLSPRDLDALQRAIDAAVEGALQRSARGAK